MEKENIITINQTHQKPDFNWAIKRYLSNFNDGELTIIGVQFPWKRVFDDDDNLEEISQNVTKLFHDFVKGNFFNSLNYTPKHKDIFLLKVKQFSSYQWVEFVFTKDKWKLKTKADAWGKKSFIFSQGKNENEDFIVSKISYEILFFYFKNPKTDENGYRKIKYKLPIYVNDDGFKNSNYQFYFDKSDGLRADLRVRNVDLLIDHDFDYYLKIRSNEFSNISGRNLEFICQGQTPKNIIFQFLKVIQENERYRYYGGGAILDLPQTHFKFKINNKIYNAGILSWTEIMDSEFENLKTFENIILEWVDKIVEFQKQN